MKIGDKVKNASLSGRVCATCPPDETCLVEHLVKEEHLMVGTIQKRLVTNWTPWAEWELVLEPKVEEPETV